MPSDKLQIEPLLCSSAEAARLCGVSKRYWLSLDSAGKVPAPKKPGSRVLWNISELREWVSNGCKPRGVGRLRGKTSPWKKAVVTLGPGDKIEFFEEV